ncbi:MAG: hypothetical protein GC157_17800 [Frankiales bacterium]|nr:hypothetical protein [Frankiales bacterium]
MRTRIRDLVAGSGVSWTAVVDAGGAGIDLATFVGDDVAPVRADDGSAIGTDVLLTVGARPDAEAGGLGDAVAALARVPEGGHALVLLGWPPADLVEAPVAGALAQAGLAPVRAVATPYPDLPVAVLVVRAAAGAESAPAGAAADGAEQPSWSEVTAEAFETALGAAAAMWAEHPEPAGRARSVGRGVDPEADAQLAELARERAALAASLSRTEAELRAARDRVARLEASTSMRVGRALVNAAKNPRSAAKLPRQALRMWRMRGGRAGLAEARRRSGESTAAASAVGESARLVAWRGASLEPRTRVSLLGVVREETEAALARHSFVVRAMPDDARPLFDRADPDLVLVETAVSASSSPWAYLGNPVATERERRLLGLVDAAQAVGRPVVLWRNTPVHETAALGDFAARCDLVVDSAPARSGGVAWSVGVSLGDAVDLGAERDSRTAVLYAGGFDARDTARRRALLVEALEAAGAALTIRPRRGGVPAHGFPGLLGAAVGREVDAHGYAEACRRAAVVVAAPFVVPDSSLGLRDDDLLALASGARLVTGPNRDLEALGLGGAVRVAPADDVAGTVRQAVADGPLTGAEHVAVLRALAESHTVAARLRRLVDRLGIDAEVGHERGVAVVVAPGTHIDVPRLVESVLRQRLRPTELVVARADVGSPSDLLELSASGVAVRTVTRPVVGYSDLARAVDAPWLAPWRPGAAQPWADTHLLDLVVGAEAGDADAVTLAASGGVRGTSALGEDVLLRRSLVVSDDLDVLDLAHWAGRGRTLVAVGSGDAS